MATDIHVELAAIRAQLDAALAKLSEISGNMLGRFDALAVGVGEILKKLEQSPTPIPTPVVAKLRAMIVTYFRQDAYWASTIAIKPPFVLINPANGDATTADSLYVAKVPALLAQGIPTFVYTYSKYGMRPEADVITAVKRQQGFYPQLKGVFVDQTGNGHSTLSGDQCLAYYGSLVPKLVALGLDVCLNLGSVGSRTPEALPLLGRYAMTREMTVVNYMAFTPLSWEIKPEHAGRFWHVAHGCSLADMPGVVARMARNGAGLATVTDDAMGTDSNPYNMPPSYIPQLDAACKAVI